MKAMKPYVPFYSFSFLLIGLTLSLSSHAKEGDKGTCTKKKMATIPTKVERLQGCDGDSVPESAKTSEEKFFEACEKSEEAQAHDEAAMGIMEEVQKAVEGEKKRRAEEQAKKEKEEEEKAKQAKSEDSDGIETASDDESDDEDIAANEDIEGKTFSEENKAKLEAAKAEVEAAMEARKEALKLFEESKTAAQSALDGSNSHEDDHDGHPGEAASLLGMVDWTIAKEEEREEGSAELAAAIGEAAAAILAGYTQEPSRKTASTDDKDKEEENKNGNKLPWTVPEDELMSWASSGAKPQ